MLQEEQGLIPGRGGRSSRGEQPRLRFGEMLRSLSGLCCSLDVSSMCLSLCPFPHVETCKDTNLNEKYLVLPKTKSL